MEFGWGYFKAFYEKVRNVSSYKLLGGTGILLLGFLLEKHLGAIFILSMLYLADIIFDFFLKFTLRPIYQASPVGIELVTFNTIIAAIAFGPAIGAFCGLLFGATYYGIIFNFNSNYQIINVPMYGVIGYLAGVLPASNVVTLGIALAATYGLVTSFLITIIFGGKLYKSIVFITTNILFNYWLFSHLGNTIVGLIV